MADTIEPGDMVQLAGWPPVLLLVLEVGDHLVVQGPNGMRIQAHRSSVTTVHRVARQVQA